MMSKANSSSDTEPTLSGCINFNDALQKAAFLLGHLRDEQVRLNCIVRNNSREEYAGERITECLAKANTAITQHVSGACKGFVQVLFCGRDDRPVLRSFADIRYAGRANEFMETDIRREIAGIIISQLCNQIARECDRNVVAGVPELLQGSYEVILKNSAWAEIQETALLELETAPGLRKHLILVIALSKDRAKEKPL